MNGSGLLGCSNKESSYCTMSQSKRAPRWSPIWCFLRCAKLCYLMRRLLRSPAVNANTEPPSSKACIAVGVLPSVITGKRKACRSFGRYENDNRGHPLSVSRQPIHLTGRGVLSIPNRGFGTFALNAPLFDREKINAVFFTHHVERLSTTTCYACQWFLCDKDWNSGFLSQ